MEDNTTEQTGKETVKKFKKKPIQVEAYQITPELIEAYQRDGIRWPDGLRMLSASFNPDGKVTAWVGEVITIHGQKTRVIIWDWIITEPDGKHYYPCKPQIFKDTFEPVDSKPQTLKTLLELLSLHGGEIVCTASLKPDQIEQARASGRMYVDENGIGYAWEPNIMMVPTTDEEVKFFEKWYPLDVEMPEKFKDPNFILNLLKEREKSPPLPEGKDKYEEEIENLFPFSEGTTDFNPVYVRAERKGAKMFRDTIHLREMKEKDERIENLEYGLKATSQREMELRADTFEWEKKLSASKEENAKQTEEIEKLRGLLRDVDYQLGRGSDTIFKNLQSLQVHEMKKAITEALKQKE